MQATCAEIGLQFDPWQVETARCILAKDSTGLYAADTVVLSIPRQVGKTFLVGALVFADCIVNPGTTTVWTAHRFKVARETFDELKAIATSPALAPHIDPDLITTAAGNESIPFRNGSRIVFAARERGAIRGFRKVRRLVLDEAQILTESAMSDLAPTMNQAPNPQMILMGTPPKPTDPGETFSNLRAEALEGTSEGVVYVEFSAPDGSDLDDKEAWEAANPSLYTRTPVRAIVRLRKLLSNDDDFAREALGMWDAAGSNTALDGPTWESLAGPTPERGAGVVFALDVAPDHSTASIAAGWTLPDGLKWVQLADHRPGVEWVVDRLTELRASWGGRLLVEQTGTAAFLLPKLSYAEPVARRFYADACSTLDADVTSSALRHGNQPELNAAVAVARWSSSGEAGQQVLSRKDPRASPLVAAALVVHSLTSKPAEADFYVI